MNVGFHLKSNAKAVQVDRASYSQRRLLGMIVRILTVIQWCSLSRFHRQNEILKWDGAPEKGEGISTVESNTGSFCQSVAYDARLGFEIDEPRRTHRTAPLIFARRKLGDLSVVRQLAAFLVAPPQHSPLAQQITASSSHLHLVNRCKILLLRLYGLHLSSLPLLAPQ